MFLTRKIIFLLLSYSKITFQIYISHKTHLKHSTTQDTAKGKSHLKFSPICSFQMSKKTHHGLCSTNIIFFSSFSFWRHILTVTQAGHSNSWEFSCLPPESWKSSEYRHAHYTTQCFILCQLQTGTASVPFTDKESKAQRRQAAEHEPASHSTCFLHRNEEFLKEDKATSGKQGHMDG